MSLERRTRLQADPEKTRAWQRRSKPLPVESAKRKAQKPIRRAVRAEVLHRDKTCQARGLVHGRCRHPEGEDLDVHEIVPRGRWALGYLDPDNCIAVCRFHHEWITTHPKVASQLGLTKSRRTPRMDS